MDEPFVHVVSSFSSAVSEEVPEATMFVLLTQSAREEEDMR